MRVTSAVPSGLVWRTAHPGSELPGYSHFSLREIYGLALTPQRALIIDFVNRP